MVARQHEGFEGRIQSRVCVTKQGLGSQDRIGAPINGEAIRLAPHVGLLNEGVGANIMASKHGCSFK